MDSKYLLAHHRIFRLLVMFLGLALLFSMSGNMVVVRVACAYCALGFVDAAIDVLMTFRASRGAA